MRVLIAVILGAMAGPALAGYLVALDAGDRMTVDGWWQDGDRIHLVRGAEELSVPRRRIRSVTQASNTTPGPAAAEQLTPLR